MAAQVQDMDDYEKKRGGNEEPTSFKRALDEIVYTKESNDITTELSSQPSEQHYLHPKDEAVINENCSQNDDGVDNAKAPRALDEIVYTMKSNDITTKLPSQLSYTISSGQHDLHPRDEAIITENFSRIDDGVDDYHAKALRKNVTRKQKRNTEQESSSITDDNEDKDCPPSKKQCLVKLNEERSSQPPSKS
ncbi:uncharacterized protein [Panulirus ornatus]|uniref:uncharacterized protein isoform X3 n=1 Tax=Panulirus ornatus TaxID=150431 RepID=UPI003A8A9444